MLKRLLIPTLALLLASCGSDSGGTGPDPDPDPPVATSLTLSSSSVTLEAIDATVQLSATVRDQFNRVMAGAQVSWASDNQAVATVSGSGLVTAVAVGETTIRATSGAAAGSASATVRQVAVEAQISLPGPNLGPGSEAQASLAVTDANGHAIPGASIDWDSSNPEVATVSQEGVVTGVSAGLTHIKGSADAVSDSTLLSVSWELEGEQISVTTDAAGEVAVYSELGGGTHFQLVVRDESGQPIQDATVEYGEVDGRAMFAVRGPGDQYAPAFLYGDVETLRGFGDPFPLARSSSEWRHPLDSGPQRAVGDAIQMEVVLPSMSSAQMAAIQNALIMATFLFERGQYEIGLDGTFTGRMCLDWEQIVQLLRNRLLSLPGLLDLVITFIRESEPTYFDPNPVPGEADVYFSPGHLSQALTASDLLAAKIELLGEMLLEGTTDRKVEVQWEFAEDGPPARKSLGVFTIRTNDAYCGGAGPASMVAIQDPIRGTPGSTHEAGVITYDEYGNPVVGINVAFEIDSGSGTLAGLTPTGTYDATDAQGRATVDWTFPETPGAYELRAWVIDDDRVNTTIYGIVEETSPAEASPTPTDLAAGNTHTCALTPDNTAYCWGRNGDGEVGTGEYGAMAYEPVPHPVDIAAGTLVGLSLGESHSCGLSADGTAYCWGQNQYHETGAGERWMPVTTPQQVSVPDGLKFQSISPGSIHTCGLGTDGQAYCWGSNDQGQLGDGVTTDPRGTAAPVAGGKTFTVVASGGIHACGLDEAGKAWCWGDNRYGQLDPDASDVEVRMEPDTMSAQPAPFVDLVAGWYHTCGLTEDRTAYCWGWNIYGQLGTGTNEPQVSPFDPVTLGSGLQQLDAGGGHTCAIGSDGLTYCWGRNDNGQVGDGTKWARYSPTLVSGEHTFAVLSVGSFHTCGLTPEGKAWCWGDGANWQLGYGDFDPFSEDPDRLVPTEVAGGLLFGRPASAPAVSWNPVHEGPWSPFWRWAEDPN